MRVYLASPFFNDEELQCVKEAEAILKEKGFLVFSPRTIDVGKDVITKEEWADMVFEIDRSGISRCDCVVALYHGMYSDTGTAWEIGFAHAKEKPVLVICINPDEEQSLMIVNGSTDMLHSIDELQDYDFKRLFEVNQVSSNDPFAEIWSDNATGIVRTFVPEKQM